MKKYYRCFLTSLLLFIGTIAFAQKNSLEIGGKLINELADWKNYGSGFGLQTIYKLTKHSGIETGLYYKISPEYYLFSDNTGSYSNEKFNKKTILIPLTYRFESKLINFTAGMAVDFLLNQKDREKNCL